MTYTFILYKWRGNYMLKWIDLNLRQGYRMRKFEF